MNPFPSLDSARNQHAICGTYLQIFGGILKGSRRSSDDKAAALLKLPVSQRENALLECSDCFAAMIANSQVGNSW